MRQALSLGGLGFAAAAAYWPTLLSAGTAPRWAALAILLPLALLLCGAELKGLGLAALVLGAIGVTFFWTSDRLTGADTFIHWGLFAVAIILGATVVKLQPLWIGIEAGVAIAAVLGIAQFFGWEGLPQVAPPAGTFLNKNILAESAMLAFITAMLSGRGRILCYLFIAAILAAHCRAVYGAVILVASVILFLKQFRLAALMIASLLGVLAFAHLEGTGSGNERLEFWQMTAQQLTYFGNGVGSFAADHPEIGKVHSELLQSLYEFGLFAIPLWGMFAFVLKDGPAHAAEVEWFVLAAILAVSFLAFPLQMPLTALAAGAAAGALAERRGLLRRVQLAWRAAVGRPDEWSAEVAA